LNLETETETIKQGEIIESRIKTETLQSQNRTKTKTITRLKQE